MQPCSAARWAWTSLKVGLLPAFVLLCGPALATPLEWSLADGGNGHYYELVRTPTDFTNARDAAAAMTYLGVPGHLATVDVPGEPYWLWANVTLPGSPDYENYWLGAACPVESFGDANGYAWVTGGPVTAEQRAFPGEEWYVDWFEGYGAYALMQSPRAWWTQGWRPQDLSQGTVINGFVVEYPIPEPMSGALLLAGVALLRRR